MNKKNKTNKVIDVIKKDIVERIGKTRTIEELVFELENATHFLIQIHNGRIKLLDKDTLVKKVQNKRQTK